MTKLPRRSSAEKKKLVWLAVRKSIPCSPSSTQTKAARQLRVIHKSGGGTRLCTSGDAQSAPRRSDGRVPSDAHRYGVGAGLATLCGGGGGVIRQSINFHTASTSNAVMMAATNCRVRVNLFRESIDPLR